jgi:hypothetical protein
LRERQIAAPAIPPSAILRYRADRVVDLTKTYFENAASDDMLPSEPLFPKSAVPAAKSDQYCDF